jgi:hypothetical protein
MWEARGISILNSSVLTTACSTNHLSQYASGFYPEVNTIDFELVFSKNSISDGLTIFMCLIVTFTVYLICMIFALINDKKDLKKLAVPFLLDNDPQDMYMYEILVETGPLYVHATTSNIYFILTGDEETTGQRCFTDPKGEKFQADPDKYVQKCDECFLAKARLHDVTFQVPSTSVVHIRLPGLFHPDHRRSSRRPQIHSCLERQRGLARHGGVVLHEHHRH